MGHRVRHPRVDDRRDGERCGCPHRLEITERATPTRVPGRARSTPTSRSRSTHARRPARPASRARSTATAPTSNASPTPSHAHLALRCRHLTPARSHVATTGVDTRTSYCRGDAGGRGGRQVPGDGDGRRGRERDRAGVLGARPRLRRVRARRRRRGAARRARRPEPHHHRHRSARHARSSAGWRLQRGTAIIEMARASGLVLAGGAEGNDPMNATTAGTGELIDAALDGRRDAHHRRARRVGHHRRRARRAPGDQRPQPPARRRAARGLRRHHPLRGRGRRVRPAEGCDARADPDADRPARTASPSSTATSSASTSATSRVRARPAASPGCWPRSVARLLPGFDLVADELDLHDHVDGADLVITGEGHLDAQSFEGKVVGGVAGCRGRARRAGGGDRRASPTTTSATVCRWPCSPTSSARSGRCANRCGASSAPRAG